jgi:peroxiredoxin Q/BCP
MNTGAVMAGLLSMFTLVAQAQELVVGGRAPDFGLYDQNNIQHKLGDLRGRWLLLYFYPKDDTPGCTREACAFRDDFRQLLQLQVALLGVSLDSRASHRAFAEKYSLPFPLLADPEGKIASAYGALWKFGPIRFARRHSFIIDPEGKIARIYRSVDAEQHSQQILQDLSALGVKGD